MFMGFTYFDLWLGTGSVNIAQGTKSRERSVKLLLGSLPAETEVVHCTLDNYPLNKRLYLGSG